MVLLQIELAQTTFVRITSTHKEGDWTKAATLPIVRTFTGLVTTSAPDVTNDMPGGADSTGEALSFEEKNLSSSIYRRLTVVQIMRNCTIAVRAEHHVAL